MLAEEFPQGSAPVHVEIGLAGTPKKEAPSSRAIGPKCSLGELTRCCSVCPDRHPEKWMFCLGMSLSRVSRYGVYRKGSGIWFRAGASFFPHFGNNPNILVCAWEYSRPQLGFKAAREMQLPSSQSSQSTWCLLVMTGEKVRELGDISFCRVLGGGITEGGLVGVGRNRPPEPSFCLFTSLTVQQRRFTFAFLSV